MQELQYRNDIVITDTNKGGAVVILDVKHWIKEAERQLKSKENYRKTKFDPTTANDETIHKVISRFQKGNLLNKKYVWVLKQKTLRHQIFTWNKSTQRG